MTNEEILKKLEESRDEWLRSFNKEEEEGDQKK